MSVNLSVKQFSQPNLISQIDDILSLTELDGSSLNLEITESAIMDNAKSATSLLKEIRSRRIQLSIDDFGTGYSSLSYLHRFPINTLKIDRSFVKRIGVNGENIGIVQAIVTLADNLGMDVVAEGVETAHQLAQLKYVGGRLVSGENDSWVLEPRSLTAVLPL
ncbi:MAG: EAL domain-containing protein [Hormoscilla sp. GUM202]|nr:EAL domain-containing protein [Hormoscilla sp. GUM202]